MDEFKDMLSNPGFLESALESAVDTTGLLEQSKMELKTPDLSNVPDPGHLTEDSVHALKELTHNGARSLDSMEQVVVSDLVVKGLAKIEGDVTLTESGEEHANLVERRVEDAATRSEQTIAAMSKDELAQAIANGSVQMQGTSLVLSELEPSVEGLFDKIATWNKDRKIRNEHRYEKLSMHTNVISERVQVIKKALTSLGPVKKDAGKFKLKTTTVINLFTNYKDYARTPKEVLENLITQNKYLSECNSVIYQKSIPIVKKKLEIARKLLKIDPADTDTLEALVKELEDYFVSSSKTYYPMLTSKVELTSNGKEFNARSTELFLGNRQTCLVEINPASYFVALSNGVYRNQLAAAQKHEFEIADSRMIEQYVKEMENYLKLSALSKEFGMKLRAAFEDIDKFIREVEVRARNSRREFYANTVRKVLNYIVRDVYGLDDAGGLVANAAFLGSVVASQVAYHSIQRHENSGSSTESMDEQEIEQLMEQDDADEQGGE